MPRFLTILIILAAAACSSYAARAGEMAPRPDRIPFATADNPYLGSVRIARVEGGAESRVYTTSRVSNTTLQDAIKNALQQSRYLSSDSLKASVNLALRLESLNTPTLGWTYAVRSRVRYTATRIVDQRVIFDREICACAKKGLSDALLAATRARLANEASIQANLEEFLRQWTTSAAADSGAVDVRALECSC